MNALLNIVQNQVTAAAELDIPTQLNAPTQPAY
jgi:hypothetical protein